jgi:hypothetical protein
MEWKNGMEWNGMGESHVPRALRCGHIDASPQLFPAAGNKRSHPDALAESPRLFIDVGLPRARKCPVDGERQVSRERYRASPTALLVALVKVPLQRWPWAARTAQLSSARLPPGRRDCVGCRGGAGAGGGAELNCEEGATTALPGGRR